MATTTNVTPYSTGFQSTLVKVEEVPMAALTGVTGTTGTLFSMKLVNGGVATRFLSIENAGSFTAELADIMIPLAAASTMVVYIDTGAPLDIGVTLQASTNPDSTGDPLTDVDATLFIS